MPEIEDLKIELELARRERIRLERRLYHALDELVEHTVKCKQLVLDMAKEGNKP